jgi:hypothetical protein
VSKLGNAKSRDSNRAEIITALQAVVSLPRQLTAEEFDQFVHLLRPYFNPHLKIELDQTGKLFLALHRIAHHSLQRPGLVDSSSPLRRIGTFCRLA